MEQNEQEILDRIADIADKLLIAKENNSELRTELADTIQEAKDAGIKYREIGNILGIGKTGISQILTRRESN